METPPTKFQLIWFTWRGGHALKNMDCLPTVAFIFSVKLPSILAFFDCSITQITY